MAGRARAIDLGVHAARALRSRRAYLRDLRVLSRQGTGVEESLGHPGTGDYTLSGMSWRHRYLGQGGLRLSHVPPVPHSQSRAVGTDGRQRRAGSAMMRRYDLLASGFVAAACAAGSYVCAAAPPSAQAPQAPAGLPAAAPAMPGKTPRGATAETPPPAAPAVTPAPAAGVT